MAQFEQVEGQCERSKHGRLERGHYVPSRQYHILLLAHSYSIHCLDKEMYVRQVQFVSIVVSFLARGVQTAATNSSNIIIAGSQSGVSLDQCNSACNTTNTALFTQCKAFVNDFEKQMKCSCSASFIASTEFCASCCDALNYDSSQLTQVLSACQSLPQTTTATSTVRTTILTGHQLAI